MNSAIDSLFEQYDRGKVTRRQLVQAMAALLIPAELAAQPAAADTPIVRGLNVNHIALTVADVERSYAFYHKLFGVTKGWPATNNGTPGVHLDFPNGGYISVDSAAPKKGVITHFSIAIDHTDQDSAKRLADKINSELPGVNAKSAFQANDGVTTVNLIDPDGVHVQISPRSGK